MQRKYRDFNRLDPRLFKAFLAAADCENFTLAAKKAALTQSGVSQQIAKLEEHVGTGLFKRINKSVVLTAAGKRLVKYIDTYLDGMDSFFEDVSDSENSLRGRVSYSMPNSCLLSPHLGMMLEKRKAVPGIELDIQIRPNEGVYRKVLDGEVDFGFVTKKQDNPALTFIPFCQEQFVLVGSKQFQKKKIDKDFLEKNGLISFPGMDVYFNSWFKTFFPKVKSFGYDFLDIKASISQLDGVLTLLQAGVAPTVLPQHCVMELLDKKKVFELTANSKKKCMNDIYIVYLKDGHISRRCRKVIDWFLEMKD